MGEENIFDEAKGHIQQAVSTFIINWARSGAMIRVKQKRDATRHVLLFKLIHTNYTNKL